MCLKYSEGVINSTCEVLAEFLFVLLLRIPSSSIVSCVSYCDLCSTGKTRAGASAGVISQKLGNSAPSGGAPSTAWEEGEEQVPAALTNWNCDPILHCSGTEVAHLGSALPVHWQLGEGCCSSAALPLCGCRFHLFLAQILCYREAIRNESTKVWRGSMRLLMETYGERRDSSSSYPDERPNPAFSL